MAAPGSIQYAGMAITMTNFGSRSCWETMALAKPAHELSMPRTFGDPNRRPPVNGTKSEREEIQSRVANFKAHQLRFEGERENFAAAELMRMWASRSWSR
jgi:hypothetical protein